jgi:hypothetical protein
MEMKASNKPLITQEDVLTMSGYIFSEINDLSVREGVVRLATALLLPLSHDGDDAEGVANLVQIAIEAYA